MSNDHAWFSFYLLCLVIGIHYFFYAVAVYLKDLPSKGLPFFIQRLQAFYIFNPSVYLKLIIINYPAYIIQLVMSAGQCRLPYLAFVQLSISHQAVYALRVFIQSRPKGKAIGNRQSLTQRTA